MLFYSYNEDTRMRLITNDVVVIDLSMIAFVKLGSLDSEI
jgi:hypothetical protein